MGGKAMAVASAQLRTEDDFWSELTKEISESVDLEGKTALVFVHGFNVLFEDAILRTAQLGTDLKLPHVAAFRWSSYGTVGGYHRATGT